MSDDLVRRLRNPIGAMRPTLTDGRAAADRIEELEAKLAMAVDFIEDLTGCEWPYDEEAKRILAELTGGNDE